MDNRINTTGLMASWIQLCRSRSRQSYSYPTCGRTGRRDRSFHTRATRLELKVDIINSILEPKNGFFDGSGLDRIRRTTRGERIRFATGCAAGHTCQPL